MNIFTRIFVASFIMSASLLLGSAAISPSYAQEESRTAGAKPTPRDSYDDTYRQLNLFGDVFERVRAQYVEEVDDKELIENSINGMLISLDPHSSYLNEDRFKEMQVQTKGEFGGLGIEVTMDNGFVKVVSPIDDTPAFRAGVQAGDYITHIDEEPVLGLTLGEAVDKMRGKVGTDIQLVIRRENEDGPIDVTITRDIIRIQSVRSHAEGNAGYIRITTFSQNTAPGLKKAMKELKEELGESLIGYVLDLRNNPGGLLDQAIAVSDVFLDKGEIVSTRGRNKNDTKRDNATSGDLAEGKPIVVLINGGSASASEIVSGALQDHKRAILLGTKSFGKGSVQTVIPLTGHGAMRLTTARYYTPSGRSIQATGIEPDIIVEQAKIESYNVRRVRESDLRGALDNGKKDKKNKKKPANDDKKDNKKDGKKSKKDGKDGDEDEEKEKPQDYQLSRALDLLNGLSFYQDKPTIEEKPAPEKEPASPSEVEPKIEIKEQ